MGKRTVHGANTKKAAEKIAEQLGKGAKILTLSAKEKAIFGYKYLVGKKCKKRRGI